VRKKLGECLVEVGLIDEKTLANALEIQKLQKKKIGQILIDMGVADEEEIAKALANQLMIPFLRVNEVDVPEEIISLVPCQGAKNHVLVPVKKTEEGLLVAMADPLDLYAVDDLRFVTQLPIRIAVSAQGEILEAIGKALRPEGRSIQSLSNRLSCFISCVW
jgi:type IV pilus assembly protein PilB